MLQTKLVELEVLPGRKLIYDGTWKGDHEIDIAMAKALTENLSHGGMPDPIADAAEIVAIEMDARIVRVETEEVPDGEPGTVY